MPKLESGLLPRTIMFKWIQGVTLCGWIVFSVRSVRGEALWGYCFSKCLVIFSMLFLLSIDVAKGLIGVFFLWHQMELTTYDLEQSTTGKLVSCDEQFCLEVNGGPLSGCTANMSCPYLQIYGDGSSTAGIFVKDYVQYDRVSGDLETTAANGSIKFGWVVFILLLCTLSCSSNSV